MIEYFFYEFLDWFTYAGVANELDEDESEDEDVLY